MTLKLQVMTPTEVAIDALPQTCGRCEYVVTLTDPACRGFVCRLFHALTDPASRGFVCRLFHVPVKNKRRCHDCIEAENRMARIKRMSAADETARSTSAEFRRRSEPMEWLTGEDLHTVVGSKKR
jgi:hypothetical protein